MYFSKWHFLFCCLVLVKIFKTFLRSAHITVLKICDELEFILCSDFDSTFKRNESYAYRYHELSSSQPQPLNIVDSSRNLENIDFMVPDSPSGKRVYVRCVDTQEVGSKAQHHTDSLLKSPMRIERTRDPVHFELDSSDPYQDSVPSTLEGMAQNLKSRKVQIDSIPERICNSENETCRSSLKAISISGESSSCAISSDEMKNSNTKITGRCLSNTSLPILPQSKASSLSTVALIEGNVNPVENTSVQGSEKQCNQDRECYSNLPATGKNTVECDYELNDEQLHESDKMWHNKGNDNEKSEQHVDETNNKLQLSSSKEVHNLSVKDNDTDLKLKTSEKTKSKNIEHNLKILNLKDPEISIDTSNETSTERSISSSAADLSKQNSEYTNNPIKDDAFKDTDEERSLNEIEDTTLENVDINLKREDTVLENVDINLKRKDTVLENVDINQKREDIVLENVDINLTRKDTTSSSSSTDIRTNVSKSVDEDQLSKAFREGNPIYLKYLTEAWSLLDKMEFAIVSLCKKHYNKTLIPEVELEHIYAGLEALLEVSSEVNELVFHFYVDAYVREMQVIVCNLEHEISESIYSSAHKKSSYYMKELSRKIGATRLMLCSVTPESQKLRIQLGKPKNSPKKKKGKRRN